MPWLLTWTHSIRENMDVSSYNMEMTCCWLAEPAVDGSVLPDVEEGTDLQRGGKVSGVCFKEGLEVPDPN